MEKANWTYQTVNGNSYFVCGEWYCRCEVRNGNNAYWYVGNDDTEYKRGFRSSLAAQDFAERMMKK